MKRTSFFCLNNRIESKPAMQFYNTLSFFIQSFQLYNNFIYLIKIYIIKLYLTSLVLQFYDEMRCIRNLRPISPFDAKCVYHSFIPRSP